MLEFGTDEESWGSSWGTDESGDFSGTVQTDPGATNGDFFDNLGKAGAAFEKIGGGIISVWNAKNQAEERMADASLRRDILGNQRDIARIQAGSAVDIAKYRSQAEVLNAQRALRGNGVTLLTGSGSFSLGTLVLIVGGIYLIAKAAK